MKLYTKSIQIEAQKRHDNGWDDCSIYRWLMIKEYTDDAADFIIAKINRLPNQSNV